MRFKRSKVAWFTAIFCWLGAILFWVGGLIALRQSASLWYHGVSTTGTVVGHEVHGDSDPDAASSFHPVVRFETAGGEGVTFVSQFGASAPDTEGHEVFVIYDPEDLRRAEIHSFAVLGFGPVMGFLGGLVFLLGGVASLAFYPES